MNKSELKAINMIAEKLNWKNKPVVEVYETIKKMVRNQQALELDTVGECDDEEETLLSIALWDKDKITSTLYVNDYESLVNYKFNLFLEDMGITEDDYKAMLDYYEHVVPKTFDEEDYYDEEYEECMMRELMWYNHARMMGWE